MGLTSDQKSIFVNIIIRCIRSIFPHYRKEDIQHIFIYGYNQLYKGKLDELFDDF